MTFAQYVAQFLERTGMSYDELSTQLGLRGYNISKQGIGRWLEKEKPSTPKIKDDVVRRALCYVLQLDEKTLVELVEGIDLSSGTKTREARYIAHLVDEMDDEMRRRAVSIVEALVK